MIGQTVSHYEILEKLGEGGMGVVYKARDLKLDRIVALKLLPHHLTAHEDERARFMQEAKAAATLNHPNICGIHALGEHESQQFIDMEFVDGVTLRQKFEHAPIKVNEAVGYAIQIADALQEAHSKGIIHRDIKADNIMVNAKHQVKVMDFGLAKLKGSLKLTKTASTVGTIAYMAPEQIQGGEVDARSDIFSFGVVLFEMLTGRLPFRGEHEAAIMYSILNEEPEQLTRYLPDVSSELIHIINTALEKVPDERYQSVAEMARDLRRVLKQTSRVSRESLSALPIPHEIENKTASRKGWRHIVTNPRVKVAVAGVAVAVFVGLGYVLFFTAGNNGERISVAVADFINETKEPELDGLSGMLITSMEQSKRLAVVTRSRMFDILKQLGKGNVDKIDEEIGKEICRYANITALVTASIRKFGRLYTIDLKVLDPIKNEYIFTAKEEAEGQEKIPAMLDKLSEKTRIGLKEKASEVTAARLQVASVTTTNLEAYKHYFQGEQYINRLKMVDAEDELRKAVALDSSFGLAWYRLAYVINWSRGDAGAGGNPALHRAIMLIDRLPEKEQYLLRALKAEQAGSWAEGIGILREMEKIYPDDKEMIYNIGDWSFHAKDFSTAAAYLEKVLRVDPTSERSLQHLAWTYRDVGQYQSMIDIAKKYVAVSGSADAYQTLGQAYELAGQFEEGIRILGSARELHPKSYEIVPLIARLYRSMGREDKAESELTMLVREGMPLEAKRIGYNALANYYTYGGRYREALRLVDQQIEMGWSMKDTALAAQDYAIKGWLIIDGWGDIEGGWKTAEKSFPYQRKIRNQNYWGVLSLIHTYRKNYDAAEAIFKGFVWWHQALRSIRYSMHGDCLTAQSLADSAIAEGLYLAALYSLLPLAECQLAAGSYDNALASVIRLRNLKEARWTTQYVKSYYLAGKIYEKRGDKNLAVQNYEKFLEIWKNADKDLPSSIDAQSRLARLKQIATR